MSLSWDLSLWLPWGVRAWGSPCFAEGGLKLSSVPFEVLEFSVYWFGDQISHVAKGEEMDIF